MHQDKPTNHVPVLLNEVLQYLDPRTGDTYLDLTAGYGGHAAEVLKQTTNPEGAVLVDRDQMAIDKLTQRFEAQKVRLIHGDFLSASRQLQEEGRRFDMIMADLGVSSPHLNIASRGFSFQQTGPLDMRMDQGQSVSAADIVNTYELTELTRILRDYGEEPKAERVAGLIVEHRPLTTTTELAAIVAKAWPGHSRVHPATRTFQALRIAVNAELEQLNQALPIWLELLAPGGRLAVISFHSLEDRIVKQFLASEAGSRYDAELRLLTKRPVTAAAHETVSNPRSRSAKLRAAVKINTKEGKL